MVYNGFLNSNARSLHRPGKAIMTTPLLKLWHMLSAKGIVFGFTSSKRGVVSFSANRVSNSRVDSFRFKTSRFSELKLLMLKLQNQARVSENVESSYKEIREYPRGNKNYVSPWEQLLCCVFKSQLGRELSPETCPATLFLTLPGGCPATLLLTLPGGWVSHGP